MLHAIDPDVVVAGTDVDANELIATSDLVVGTFSTTLLQAVALDRPAVGRHAVARSRLLAPSDRLVGR